MLNKKYIIMQFDDLGSQQFKRKQKFLRKLEAKLYFSQIKRKKSGKGKMELFLDS
jgi:hypothetical protein